MCVCVCVCVCPNSRPGLKAAAKTLHTPISRRFYRDYQFLIINTDAFNFCSSVQLSAQAPRFVTNHMKPTYR